MENLRAFKVETLQETDTKPTRVKVIDTRFSKSVVLTYGAKTARNEKDLVVDFLKNLGIEITAQAWSEDKKGIHLYSMYLTKNFDTQIK